MRRLTAIGLGLVMSLMLLAVTAAAVPTRFIALPVIGIQNLHLDGDFVKSGAPDEMAAFVETGSLNPRCLATCPKAKARDDVPALRASHCAQGRPG